MALSNAERQKRYRQRRKVARCVTPEMIGRVARRLYELDSAHDPAMLPWEEWCASKAGKQNWIGNLPDDPDMDFPELGADAEAASSVAAVVRAVKYPPTNG